MKPGKKTSILTIISSAGFLMVTLQLFFSCNRPEGFIGDEYRAAPEGFYVISNSFQVTPSSVNFTTEKDTLIADFSHVVTWSVTLKGLQSGATKKIFGTSISIGNQVWNGGHDGLYFFRQGEQVVAELSFLGSSIILTDTVTITTAKSFSNQGFLVGSFDAPSLLPFGGPYADLGESIFGGVDNTIVPNVQGVSCVTFHGVDLNNGYYIMGMNRPVTAGEYSLIPMDPDSVYLNVYAYGRGNAYPTARLSFSVAEDENGNNLHDPATEDSYDFSVATDHTGWKLFSIKYSDLAVSTAPLYGGSGNKVKEPKNIRQVGFSLIDSGPGNEAKVTFDYAIITFGAPFDPGK